MAHVLTFAHSGLVAGGMGQQYPGPRAAQTSGCTRIVDGTGSNIAGRRAWPTPDPG